MSTLQVTNTFVSGTTAVASQVNANFDDVVNYINNRDSGSAAWSRVLATNSSSVPAVFDNSSGTNNILDCLDNGAIVWSIVDGGYVRGVNGSASTPTYSATSDPDTGMYFNGSNGILFATTGTLRMTLTGGTLTGTFITNVGDGSAGTPAYSFASDANTGIYSSGADGIGFSTGGTVKLTLSGGTLTGAAGLVFKNGEGTISDPSYSFQSDTDSGMYSVSANVVGIAAGGAAGIRVDNTSSATATRLLVYDVDTASVVRVSVGTANSGGAGFKLLKIPN